VLFSNPDHFEYLVSRSSADHPYTSYILSYKHERQMPSRADRDQIHAAFLRLLRGGLKEECVYVLGVDHGDHEHGAVYRHLIEPRWRRFQPFYHKADLLSVSDFQWLVNRRYGLTAPENPINHQLVSLAGKHFGDDAVQFLATLREQVRQKWETSWLQNHEGFIELLKHLGYEPKLESHPAAGGSEALSSSNSKRVWLRIRVDETDCFLKGPLCSPDFKRCQHEKKQAEARAHYESFQHDPFSLWQRFLDGIEMRRKRNQKRYRGLCETMTPDAHLGFADLHPDRHVKPSFEM